MTVKSESCSRPTSELPPDLPIRSIHPKRKPEIMSSITEILQTDPRTQMGRGHLMAVARNSSSDAARQIAQSILDATPAVVPALAPTTSVPDWVQTMTRYPAESRRDLHPAERSLMQLMGARRDELTDDEAGQVARLAAVAADDADRELGKYVLAPALARVEAVLKAATLAAARHALNQIPAHPAPLGREVESAARAALVAEVSAEMPALALPDAHAVAARKWNEARAEAQASLESARNEARERVAALTAAPSPRPLHAA